MEPLRQWQEDLKTILREYQSQAQLKPGQLFVVGCSTSEVVGELIGTAGTLEIAKMIFEQLQSFAKDHSLHLAFQCCEHLNRALVVEREVAERYQLEEVTVVPVRKAGGAMATYAFEHFQDPVVVEQIQAHGGIDIGDTLIGMHLKRVAVPVRTSLKQIGHAHVTLAKTRPKLIGGVRAVYERTTENESCSS
jgi:uncharacterized protein (TIGR01440 family)